MTEPSLPVTAREIFRFRPGEALLYRAILRGARATGLWRYPAHTTGDLEEMRRRDILYWLYKAGEPVRRAERGSGLERFFESQRAHAWTLPAEFAVTDEVRLSAVGDLMPHPFLAGSAESLYSQVEDLVFDADVAMANLESMVIPGAKGALEFRVGTKDGPSLHFGETELDVVAGVQGRRFHFMSTACNHSLDLGEEGVASTVNALRARGITFHGLNETEEAADEMAIVETAGVRVGVVAFTFGLNAKQPPPHRPHIVNRMRLNGPIDRMQTGQLERQLSHGKRAGVEFVVAQLHWGLEFEFYPRPVQRTVAHALAELGVDAIVGHHPHVVQPTEWYTTRRDPQRVVPIYYSLGNLTNPFSADFMCESGVARMTLAKGHLPGEAPKVLVKDASLVVVEQTVLADDRRLTLRAPFKRS